MNFSRFFGDDLGVVDCFYNDRNWGSWFHNFLDMNFRYFYFNRVRNFDFFNDFVWDWNFYSDRNFNFFLLDYFIRNRNFYFNIFFFMNYFWGCLLNNYLRSYLSCYWYLNWA